MSIISWAAGGTGVVMGLSGIPQILRIVKNKSAKDVSSKTYIILLLGSVIWLLYSIEIESKSENRTVRNLIGNKFNSEYIQLGFFSALPLKHKKPLPAGRGSYSGRRWLIQNNLVLVSFTSLRHNYGILPSCELT